MSEGLDRLLEQYGAALRTHLAGSSEAVLRQAYEMGRRAVADGLGLLELGLLHHRALRLAIEGNSSIDKAAEFFAESLSPFEMLLRGYRESNASLLVANERLRQAKLEADAVNHELEAFSYSVRTTCACRCAVPTASAWPCWKTTGISSTMRDGGTSNICASRPSAWRN